MMLRGFCPRLLLILLKAQDVSNPNRRYCLHLRLLTIAIELHFPFLLTGDKIGQQARSLFGYVRLGATTNPTSGASYMQARPEGHMLLYDISTEDLRLARTTGRQVVAVAAG